MNIRVLLVLVFLSALSFMAFADGGASRTNEDIYRLSIFAPPTSVRCVEVLPNFKQEYDPAYAAWASRNRAQIDAGRESAKLKLKPGEAIDAQESRLVRIVSLGLGSFPPEQLKSRCNQLLDQLFADGKTG